MAIDFPATSGQATDGSYTHTASGITWGWDGTTWKAQGVTGSFVLPVASSTQLGGIKVGSGLSINNEVLSRDAIALNDLSDVTTGTISTGNVLKWNGSAWAAATDSTSAYTNADVDSHLNKNTANTGEVLSWNGTDYDWVTQSGGGGSQTLDQVLATGNTTSREIITTGKIYYSNNFADLTALQAVSASTYHGMFAHVHAEGHGYFGHAGGWVQLLDTSSSIEELGNVTISSPSNGQVLKYNGSAWVNDTDATGGGGGGSYANSDVDAHLNTGSASSGEILSWNGSDYAWVADQTGGGGGGGAGTPTITWTLTANASSDYIFSGDGFPTPQNDPTLYLIRGQTYKFTNNTGGHPFRIQSTGAQAGGGTQYNSGVTNQDASGASNQTLTFVVPMDAPDTLYYQCTAHPAMFGTITILSQGSSTPSRQNFSQATSSIADGAVDTISITAFKTFALLKVQTSAAAWVTLYKDSSSRSADSGRNETTDPLPGSGVLAEVITTGAQTVAITPGVFGWNDDATPAATVYAKVVNKSGSTQAITVTITAVKLEG